MAPALAGRLAWVSVSRAAEAVGQRAAPERSADRLVPRWAGFAAVALFLALGLWVAAGMWVPVRSRARANGGSDVPFFEGPLVHATRIFTHAENPLFTPQM